MVPMLGSTSLGWLSPCVPVLPVWLEPGWQLAVILLLVMLQQHPVQAACASHCSNANYWHFSSTYQLSQESCTAPCIRAHCEAHVLRPGQAASCLLQDDQWFLESPVPVGWNTGLGVFCWAALAACTIVAIHRWYWVKRAGKRW